MRAPQHTVSSLQRVGRVLWPTLWLFVIPLLVSGVVFRYLVPARAPDVGAARWLVRVAAEYPVRFLSGLVLVFAVILHSFRRSLPGSQWFSWNSPAFAAAAERPSETARWRVARSLAPWLVFGAIAALLLLLGRSLGEVYLVRDASMLPTLNRNDQVLARTHSSLWRKSSEPRRGELVVIRDPGAKAATERIGRVLGLAGDTISLRKGRPSINGWEIPACPAGRYLSIVEGERVDAFLLVEFLENDAYLALGVPSAPSMDHYEVPKGQVFVLGDNRTRIRGARNGKLEGSRGDPVQAIAGKVERVALRRRPDGQLDPASMLAPIGLGVQIDGLNVADLQAKIAACLAKRPADTRPPGPGALRAAFARSGASDD